ncbi:MAG: hypothetical protein ACR2HO_12165, partial [Rubrobacteraceae bacterium]
MIPDRTDQLGKLHAEHIARPGDPSSLASRRPDPYIGNGTLGNGTRDAVLSDAEIIELCRRTGNAAKFERLYDRGDTAEYGGDDSAADLALVGVIAFYTQDPEQLDRLFRGSALYRPEKWGRRPDYRQRTINRVLDRLTEVYSPPGEKVRVSLNGHHNTSSQRPESCRERDAGRKRQAVVSLTNVKEPGPPKYVVGDPI